MVREDGHAAVDVARAAIAELEMGLEDTPEALFLMLLPGRDIEALIADLPYPEDDVRAMFDVAVKNRIRVGDKVQADWMDEQHGVTTFLLDVMVMQGLLERA